MEEVGSLHLIRVGRTWTRSKSSCAQIKANQKNSQEEKADGGNGIWTRGLSHAKRALYPWAIPPTHTSVVQVFSLHEASRDTWSTEHFWAFSSEFKSESTTRDCRKNIRIHFIYDIHVVLRSCHEINDKNRELEKGPAWTPSASSRNPRSQRKPRQLILPAARTTRHTTSFFFSASVAWNTLPAHIQNLTNAQQFRKALTKHFYSQRFTLNSTISHAQ